MMLAYKATKPEAVAPDLPIEQRWTRQGESGTTYVVPIDAVRVLRSVARKLGPYLDDYPASEAVTLFLSWVIQTIDVGMEVAIVPRTFEFCLDHFLTSFASATEWEIVHALRNISTAQCEFTFGPCYFYYLGDNRLAYWGRRIATKQYDAPVVALPSESWMSENEQMLGQVVAATKVTAVDSFHATEKSLRLLNEAISILRFGQLIVGLPRGWAIDIGHVGHWTQQSEREHSFTVNLGTFWSGHSYSSCGPGMGWYDQVEGLCFWPILDRLVSKNRLERTEMECRLSAAMHWIGQAAAAPSDPICFVTLVTALETLLIEDGESLGKKSKLAHRISWLVGDCYASRKELADEVSRVYKLRSECVHAGLSDIVAEDVKALVVLLVRIVAALCCNEPYRSKSSLGEIVAAIEENAVQDELQRREWVSVNAYFRWLRKGQRDEEHMKHWLDAELEYCTTAASK